MKYVLVFNLLIVAVMASPLGSNPTPSDGQVPMAEIFPVTPIPIVRQELSIENGTFVNSFETGHGIIVNESGSQKQIGSASGTVSSGSFAFTNPEGAIVTVTWIANENGFQATGDHLPTPPPTPDHVIKLLADMEAALDAISIATENTSVVHVPEAPMMAAFEDPIFSFNAHDEMAARSPAAVAFVPAEAIPVENGPLVETVLDEITQDEAIPVGSAQDGSIEPVAPIQSVESEAQSTL